MNPLPRRYLSLIKTPRTHLLHKECVPEHMQALYIRRQRVVTPIEKAPGNHALFLSLALFV